jgi:hypothetical protein
MFGGIRPAWECLKFKLARGVPSIAQGHKFSALLLTVGLCHICELIQSASTNANLLCIYIDGRCLSLPATLSNSLSKHSS